MKLHGQRGSTVVEFAIVVMGLMLFLLGIIEFGQALYTYHAVANAARIGTRYAIVRGTDAGSACGSYTDAACAATSAQIQSFVQAQAVLPSPGPTVSPSWSTASYYNPGTSCGTGTHGAGCLVSVTVTYPFKFNLPLLSPITLNFSSTSQMIVSQ